MPTDIDVDKITQEKYVFMEARIDYKGKEQFVKFDRFVAPKPAWVADLQPGKKCQVVAKKEGAKLKVTIMGKSKADGKDVKHVAGLISFV